MVHQRKPRRGNRLHHGIARRLAGFKLHGIDGFERQPRQPDDLHRAAVAVENREIINLRRIRQMVANLGLLGSGPFTGGTHWHPTTAGCGRAACGADGSSTAPSRGDHANALHNRSHET